MNMPYSLSFKFVTQGLASHGKLAINGYWTHSVENVFCLFKKAKALSIKS